jgi:hypothetical protein
MSERVALGNYRIAISPSIYYGSLRSAGAVGSMPLVTEHLKSTSAFLVVPTLETP